MGGSGAGGAYLQYPISRLYIKCEYMAAEICQHIMPQQHFPKAQAIPPLNQSLVITEIAIHRPYRMMTEDKLVLGIAVLRKRFFQPIGLDSALTAAGRPQGVDEDHKQVAASDELGQAKLIHRSILWQMRHLLTKHIFAGRVVNCVIARGVVEGDSGAVHPSQLARKEIAPLLPQFRSVRRKPHDFIAEKTDELRRCVQGAYRLIDLSEIAFVQ